MINMNEIKNRIGAISQTRKITKAMHLISTVKMRNALEKQAQNKTYIDKIRAIIKDILYYSHGIEHPFLNENPGDRTAFIVIAGDKGLCGPYNHNILNMAVREMEGIEEKYIFTVGHMATSFFNRKNYMVDIEFLHTAQNPQLENARQIAEVIIDLYNQKLIDRVKIIYTHLITTLTQETRSLELLPLARHAFDDVELEHKFSGTFEYDPSPTVVFDDLVPQYIIGVIYAALVQAFASEQSNRMRAMESATDNADKIITRLNHDYTRARQRAITEEITEIINGANAAAGR
jgi:F-type H+-transporting ATPase subunit gamma